MKIEYLVDTHVLAAAYDRSQRLKQEMAFDLLDQLARDGNAAVSTQILAEFFVAATRDFPARLTLDEANTSLENYLRAWQMLEVTGFVLLEAGRGVRAHNLGYWDAQVWATAKLNQVPVVLSEAFSTGSLVEGVRFVDPFAAYFNLRE